MDNYIKMMKFSPSPSNINYMWNFGSLLIMILMVQLVTGIFISFHYTSYMENSFMSVIHITREVNFGWMVRFFHINGASMFFLIMFLHMMKNINNSSWKYMLLWFSGVIILILSMMVAFLGYVLPWGQMSFWAATVITNLLSVIPYIGNMIVEWVWGGFSVSYPTLIRFFSFHFMFPFIILFLVGGHIILLHMNGSSNSINSPLSLDKISFDPFFTVKDIMGVIVFICFFMMMIFLNPYMSVDSENFIEANPLVTPIHIKPEWYFLFAYAILRSIPNKLGGVLALMMSLMILLVKPFQKFNKMKFNYYKKNMNYLFYFNFIMLTYLGGKAVAFPFEELSKIFSCLYFIIVLLI